jgi:ATP-dependent DNA helicase RecG
MEGTRQSGEAFELRAASLGKDGQILQYARNIAEKVIDEDPNLKTDKNRILNRELEQFNKEHGNWGEIS